MKTAANKFISLVIYSLVVFAVMAMAILVFPIQITLTDLVLPGFIFLVITALSLLVFLIGTVKSPESQPLYTMGALGLMFFLSMIFALIYFIVLKNTTLGYIILFFLLYLAFTIYLLRGIVKILKIKSLK